MMSFKKSLNVFIFFVSLSHFVFCAEKGSLSSFEYDFFNVEGEGLFEFYFKRMKKNLFLDYHTFKGNVKSDLEMFKSDFKNKFSPYLKKKAQKRFFQLFIFFGKGFS